MSTGDAVVTGTTEHDQRHGLRLLAIWAVLTVAGVLVIVLLVGPHIPPFHGSEQSAGQHDINVFLTALAWPVAMMIWVYLVYAVVVFRQPKTNADADTVVDGPPITGNPRIAITWLAATTLIVLALAVYGTSELFGSSKGAGGGQGPNPLVKPPASAQPLEVQVIGQQWAWTFRYPSYGGVETAALVLPKDRWIVFHVTSLDVAHSFWAYELGVKADAIPGTDNVDYVKPTKAQKFQIRCAELCGLWHGHMNTEGQVMTQAAFATWIAQQQSSLAAVTKTLPPYSHSYYPDPLRRAG